MSRSYRKHLAWGITSKRDSNKKDRSIANRKMRRINKVITKTIPDFDDYHIIGYDEETGTVVNFYIDEFEYKKLREVSDVWDFPTDGLRKEVNPHALVHDWEKGNQSIDLSEAIKNKNFKTYSYFRNK